jgi:hypothetical protein
MSVIPKEINNLYKLNNAVFIKYTIISLQWYIKM